MTTTGYDWGDWTTLVQNQPLAHGGQWTSDAQSLDGFAACELAVECQYVKGSGTIAQGAKVYALRETAAGAFEAEADGPWGFEMPYADADCVRRRAFAVDPAQAGGLKLLVTYGGGAGSSLLLTVRRRNAVLQSN